MSRTYNHIIEAKFKNKIITLKQVPLSVRKKWNRHNFEGGHFKNLRNIKRYNLKSNHYEEIN
jgi:hypothetical protein